MPLKAIIATIQISKSKRCIKWALAYALLSFGIVRIFRRHLSLRVWTFADLGHTEQKWIVVQNAHNEEFQSLRSSTAAVRRCRRSTSQQTVTRFVARSLHSRFFKWYALYKFTFYFTYFYFTLLTELNYNHNRLFLDARLCISITHVTCK